MPGCSRHPSKAPLRCTPPDRVVFPFCLDDTGVKGIRLLFSTWTARRSQAKGEKQARQQHSPPSTTTEQENEGDSFSRSEQSCSYHQGDEPMRRTCKTLIHSRPYPRPSHACLLHACFWQCIQCLLGAWSRPTPFSSLLCRPPPKPTPNTAQPSPPLLLLLP